MEDDEAASHRSTEMGHRVREIVEVSKFLATGIAFFEFQPSACDGCQRQSQSLGSDQNVLQPVTGLALCTAPGNFGGGVHKLAGQQGRQ